MVVLRDHTEVLLVTTWDCVRYKMEPRYVDWDSEYSRIYSRNHSTSTPSHFLIRYVYG
jgi:hypothetical protein